MSTDDLDLTPEQEEALDPNIREALRRTRENSAKAREAEARAEAAERQLAFHRAGVPDSPLGEMFAKAYDGPTDDPAVIKAAFDELGVPAETAGTTEPPPDLDADRRIAQAGSSGEAAAGSVRLEDAIRSAQSEKDVMDLVGSAPADSGIRPAEIT